MKKSGLQEYAQTFEDDRRTSPRLWDVDYCLLQALKHEVIKFSTERDCREKIMLDFGCGAKPYRRFFPQVSQYLGVDTIQSPYADVIVNPGEKVPLPSGSVDIILSTQVVYLIPDYREYLSECRRLLSKGGYLLITSHGTWTHHPASGGDYYRFTKDGLTYILGSAGFEVQEMRAVVGTLAAGLHLRQLVINAWLTRIGLGYVAKLLNIFTNLRIQVEDKITPEGTRMSSPVILVAIARAIDPKDE
jgi:SAM-dependent methyltransferase